jgi:hypothetical protein
MDVLPGERVAYFHQRNLAPDWIESPDTLDDEAYYHVLLPRSSFLWEPKRIDDPGTIRKLLREHRTPH